MSTQTKNSTVTKEQVFEDLKKVVEEAQALLKNSTQEQFNEKAAAARAALAATLDEVRANTDRAKAKANDLSVQTVESIQKNPLASVGIALGAGLILGALLNRDR